VRSEVERIATRIRACLFVDNPQIRLPMAKKEVAGRETEAAFEDVGEVSGGQVSGDGLLAAVGIRYAVVSHGSRLSDCESNSLKMGVAVMIESSEASTGRC
jgi:hypothetical protein